MKAEKTKEQKENFDVYEEPFEETEKSVSHIDVEMARLAKRQAALKALSLQEVPYAQSKLFLGAEFDIVDAFRKTIDGEKVVSFILELKHDVADFKKGSLVSVSKRINSYTETYLDYFESFVEGEKIQPLYGYTFVEEGKAVSGNKPIILRKL